MDELIDLMAVLMSDPFGRRWLRNSLDAVDAGVMSSQMFGELLQDFAAELTHIAADKGEWPHALANVCTGQSDRSGRVPRAYILSGNRPSNFHSAKVWTTVVSGDAWLNFHVDRTKPESKPWPSFPVGQDSLLLREFQDFVSQDGWLLPSSPSGGAWLGRPMMQNTTCWVSSDEMDTEISAPQVETKGSSRQVGWALGLPHAPTKARVRYKIDANAVRSKLSCDGRRPTPADMASEWFRIRVSGDRGAFFNDQGWGCTANLHSVWSDQSDIDGRPEQVLPSIPVDGGCIVAIECLMADSDDHDFTDPSLKFDATLHGSAIVSDINEALQQRVEHLFKS